MTRKELLIKAINFEEVPRVPVSTLSGATWAVKQENMSPEERRNYIRQRFEERQQVFNDDIFGEEKPKE